MAVHIRLARHGSKRAPYYRIVVADVRSPRDGKFVEKLGLYNPVAKPKQFQIAQDRLAYWLERGARPSDTLAGLLKRHPAEPTEAGS